MTRDDIELLFQSESYDEAMKLLRKELQEDSENAEWYYYLFLAENKDYANINFEDVACEFDFNRALDFANARLRELFLAEYNFYKAVDPMLRKYFAYASRGNIDKFEELLDTYGNRTTNLIHNSSSTKDFFSNLDYLVTTRVKHEIVDLNILALNLLYLATYNKKVLEIYKLLKVRANEIGTALANVPLANFLKEIKECINAIRANKNASLEEKRKELELLAESLDNKSKRIDKDKEELIQREEKLLEAQALLDLKEKQKNSKSKQSNYINNNLSKEKPSYFTILGWPIKFISLTVLFVSFIVSAITVCLYVIGYGSVVFPILGLIVFLLNGPVFYLTTIALKRHDKKENGAYPSLVFNFLTFIFTIISYIFGLLGLFL